MSDALLITVIGMGLVSGAIALLWGLMLGLMRATEERGKAEVQARADELEQKRRAAIAAVAVALAYEDDLSRPHDFPLPPTAIVTAWQAVQRGNLLSQKGPKR